MSRLVCVRPSLGAAAVLLMSVPALRAQEGADPLLEALAEHRYELRLTAEGSLLGRGGQLLLREGRDSHFLLIGEEHGIAQVPELAAALFRALQPAGYRQLAVEIGRSIADTLDGLIAGSISTGADPEGAITAFYREHPPGAPFFNVREDARLLVDAVRAVGREDVVWGLDYDILGDRYALRRLRELAPSAAARAAADSAIRLADARFASAFEQRNPVGSVMFSGPEDLFPALRETYEPDEGSEPDRILHLLDETVRINRLFVDRQVYESNDRRAALNKRTLAEYMADAADRDGEFPRVLFRFGANHMMRGRTATNVYDLGSMAAALGEALGSGSFHLLVVGGPGTEHLAFDPRAFGWVPVPVDADSEGRAGPFVESLLDGWTLFDLRPLRPLADRDRLGELDAGVERTIFAFDALLVLVGSRAGEPLPGSPWLP